jgi:hypothetical protein
MDGSPRGMLIPECFDRLCAAVAHSLVCLLPYSGCSSSGRTDCGEAEALEQQGDIDDADDFLPEPIPHWPPSPKSRAARGATNELM